VTGADGRFRLGGTSILEFHALGSFSADGDGAKTERGDALGIRYYHESRSSCIETGLQHISEDFRTDVGYVTRTGILQFPMFASYTFRPHSTLFQKIEPFYWAYHIRDLFSGLWETCNFFVLRVGMPRQSQLRLEGILSNEVFADRRFPTSGYGVRGFTQIVKQLYLEGSLRFQRKIFYDEETPFPGRGKSFGLYLTFQPTGQLNFGLDCTYADFFRLAGGGKVYDYTILRSRSTFQLNKYLFFRGIAEYNSYYKNITLDALASFTYIPGTVVYVGYGSLLEKTDWNQAARDWQPSSAFHQHRRSFFFKASYLWRF
jgi:hypothetical protein